MTVARYFGLAKPRSLRFMKRSVYSFGAGRALA
jgi:hypothetical protein